MLVAVMVIVFMSLKEIAGDGSGALSSANVLCGNAVLCVVVELAVLRNAFDAVAAIKAVGVVVEVEKIIVGIGLIIVAVVAVPFVGNTVFGVPSVLVASRVLLLVKTTESVELKAEMAGEAILATVVVVSSAVVGVVISVALISFCAIDVVSVAVFSVEKAMLLIVVSNWPIVPMEDIKVLAANVVSVVTNGANVALTKEAIVALADEAAIVEPGEAALSLAEEAVVVTLIVVDVSVVDVALAKSAVMVLTNGAIVIESFVDEVPLVFGRDADNAVLTRALFCKLSSLFVSCVF